jgi:hypothetical protein
MQHEEDDASTLANADRNRLDANKPFIPASQSLASIDPNMHRRTHEAGLT